jgi:hypothetical protein
MMDMAGDDIQVESAACELSSGIQKASAMLIKAAYLSVPSQKQETEFGDRFFQTLPVQHDEEIPGPDARAYIAKISALTPYKEVKRILGTAPGREAGIRTQGFYTLLFYLNIQLDEPSTTRFINAIVSFSFSPEITVLEYSPREKETLGEIAASAGDELFISPALTLRTSPPQRLEADDPDQRFEVRVGPEEKISMTYSRKSGYSLRIPKYEVLEYEGMRKSEHEVCWEIYPPMPPKDSTLTGRGMHAIFSLIVQAPRTIRPGVSVHIEGKVKGAIWGVVPIKGSVNFF